MVPLYESYMSYIQKYVSYMTLVVRVVDLRPRGLPCIGAQVKDESHVVIWTVCKRTHNQYETSCEFRSHPRECLYASASIISLSISPNYQYQYRE